MKNARVTISMLLFAAATAALAPGASAQVSLALPGAPEAQLATDARGGSDIEPEQFGSGWSLKIIPAASFAGMGEDDTYHHYLDGYVTPSTGRAFWVPIDLPPGIEVAQVCLFAYDVSSSAGIDMWWAIHHMGDSTGGAGTVIVAAESTGVNATPGFTLLCAGPGTTNPYLIRAYADVDGDGTPDYNWHRVRVNAEVDNNIRWGGAFVQWRRAMSPAPTTATFPNDVPTTHGFFRNIEALAASGVTLGCATGSFCPDQAVTRAQMAAFVTRALGLHWPY